MEFAFWAGMNGETLQQIKNVLLERWTDLGELMNRAEKENLNMSSNFEQSHAEIIDMAQTLEQMDRDASLAEQERREMHAVERALAKMSTGNFGICEDCAEEIPSRRLMAIPSARLCANCQAYEERQNARMRTVAGAAR